MEANYFTILYWFCHTSTWIHHRCTRAPHPEPPSHLPPCNIPPGHTNAPAPSILYPSILYPASNLDWRFVSYMILYLFQSHSPKSSHPLHLPQSPKDCSIHLCLFCCLTYRVIVTIFLNSIYMHSVSSVQSLSRVQLFATPNGHFQSLRWSGGHKNEKTDETGPNSQPLKRIHLNQF